VNDYANLDSAAGFETRCAGCGGWRCGWTGLVTPAFAQIA